MRCSFTHQVRQIDQTVGTDRCFCSFCCHQIVRIYALFFCFHFICITEIVAIPFQRLTSCQCNAHHMPCARNCAAKSMYSALRVDGKFICVGKYHARSTDGSKSSTIFYNTCTNSCRCVIASTAYNDGTFFQSCQCSRFGSNRTCYFRTFIYFCKHCRINIQFF